MNQPKVSIIKANDYDYAEVHVAIERVLELIGGLDKVVSHRNQVFVKIIYPSPATPP